MPPGRRQAASSWAAAAEAGQAAGRSARACACTWGQSRMPQHAVSGNPRWCAQLVQAQLPPGAPVQQLLPCTLCLHSLPPILPPPCHACRCFACDSLMTLLYTATTYRGSRCSWYLPCHAQPNASLVAARCWAAAADPHDRSWHAMPPAPQHPWPQLTTSHPTRVPAPQPRAIQRRLRGVAPGRSTLHAAWLSCFR